MNKPAVLVIGTYDTKADELDYLAGKIESQGAAVVSMDVGVLGDPPGEVHHSKHVVAAAASSSIEEIIALGDENAAMQVMAKGAAALTHRLFEGGEINAMIAMGGTMGTDLALDCARALPMGVPKYVISTVAYSPIINAGRLAADVQMILWAGGLYGLNSLCKSSLSQAAGAVVGAARAAEPPRFDKPVIGMTSLGKSCLSYMVTLKPALEQRGFEVAVFHATGMGGRAFESLAAEGVFAAVMDFALPEVGNLINGSIINGGRSRMLNAGRHGIPQLIAPGCIDLIDLPTWQEVPEKFADRPYHAHNRLIASVALNPEERRATARAIGERLQQAKGPVHVVLPNLGIEEWDREGGDAHDPAGLAAFLDEMRNTLQPPVALTEIDAHINDPLFCTTVLDVFDGWLAEGTIAKP